MVRSPDQFQRRNGAMPLHTVVSVVNEAAVELWKKHENGAGKESPPSANGVVSSPSSCPGPASASVLAVGQDNRTVYCPSADLSTIETLEFDGVYGLRGPQAEALTHEEAETELFNGSVQRLVAAALGAQDGTLIISGESDAAKRLVLHGHPGNSAGAAGLLERIAGAVFTGLGSEVGLGLGASKGGSAWARGNKNNDMDSARPIRQASVNFSWCTVAVPAQTSSQNGARGASGSRTIEDLLCSFCGSPTCAPGSGPMGRASDDTDEAAPSVVLRSAFLGAASGTSAGRTERRRRAPSMVGALEVEVERLADVQELVTCINSMRATRARQLRSIAALRRRRRNAAESSDAGGAATAGKPVSMAHDVITLTIEERSSRVQGSGSSGSVSTGRVGRIRILVLASEGSNDAANGACEWSTSLLRSTQHAATDSSSRGISQPGSPSGPKSPLRPQPPQLFRPLLRRLPEDGLFVWVAAVESGLAESAHTMRALTLAAHMARACGLRDAQAHTSSIITSTTATAAAAAIVPSATAAAAPTRRASQVLHRTLQSSKQPISASPSYLQKSHLPPALLRAPPSIQTIDTRIPVHMKSAETLDHIDDSFVAAEAAAEAEAEAEADMEAKAGGKAGNTCCSLGEPSDVPSPTIDVHEPPPPPPAYPPPPATATATLGGMSAPPLALRELNSTEVTAHDKQLLAALEASRAEIAQLQERVLDGSQRLQLAEDECAKLRTRLERANVRDNSLRSATKATAVPPTVAGSGSNGHLSTLSPVDELRAPRHMRTEIRRLRSQLDDYETYKHVMNEAVQKMTQRMQDERVKMENEKSTLQRQLRRARAQLAAAQRVGGSRNPSGAADEGGSGGKASGSNSLQVAKAETRRAQAEANRLREELVKVRAQAARAAEAARSGMDDLATVRRTTEKESARAMQKMSAELHAEREKVAALRARLRKAPSAAGGTSDQGQRELQRKCASPAVARNAQGAGAETASVRDNFTTGVLSNLRSRRRTRTAERRHSPVPKQQKGPAAVGSHGEDWVEGDGESAGEGSAEGRLAVGIAALAKDLVGALDST